MTTMRSPDFNRSASRAWLRALELIAPIPDNPNRILPSVIGDLAEVCGDKPAILSDAESLTFRALADRSHQYTRWAVANQIVKGDVVCLLMPNRPEYMAIWLGIIRTGGVVSLLNTNLDAHSLAHCINIVAPKHIIASAELLDPLTLATREANAGAKLLGPRPGCGSDAAHRSGGREIFRRPPRQQGSCLHDLRHGSLHLHFRHNRSSESGESQPLPINAMESLVRRTDGYIVQR